MNRAVFMSVAVGIASLNALAGPLDTNGLRNPVWTSKDNLRDPSVLKVEGGYQVFYSRLAGHWANPSSWTVANAFTRDFKSFENVRDVSPKGHASPGDVVRWHGRWILPYQTYPEKPTHLVFAESADLKAWSAPKPFLKEAMDLPWNDAQRVIDATLVVEGDTLHCWFVGTTMKPSKANLLGYAVTRDPNMEKWEILTRDAPLLGRSARAPDGVENVIVYRTGDHWTMLFSEGLREQHPARATSPDLRAWTVKGEVDVRRQEWMAAKYGAPFVWPEGEGWAMILMGENRQDRTTFGLLTSPDGLRWTCLPERAAGESARKSTPTFAPSPGWSLASPPAVPAPAAPGSKPPADPKDSPEVKMGFRIADGPFEPTWDSIRRHYPGAPAWFHQAKFGVFVHWGPQASGRSGDWYARNLYRQGHPAYANHLKNFGHPSETGYKDVLRAWTAPKWDAAALTKAFHDAGMRFMMVVGVHHDNYDLWDSAYNPWDSVRVGPKKDMIGGWAREARKLGMRFGVTFHHEYSWWWWADAYKSDATGPKTGVPYDGNLTLADGKGAWWEGLDPRLLYNINLGEYTDGAGHSVTEIAFGRKGIFQDHREYAKWYAERWALRIMDAIDKYDPDMFYTDGNSSEPFSGDHSGSGFKCDAGRRVVAHFYNRALAKHGAVDTLALIKFQQDNPAVGMTYEINIPRAIMTNQAWIGENPIGDWYYAPGYTYEAVTLVRSLIEYASRGGNYACAVPVNPEGGLEPPCAAMLRDMGDWMRVNGEGLYGSRAWDAWGEGNVVMPNGKLGPAQVATPYTAADLRFTANDGAVYAWLMAWPEDGTVTIRSLGEGAGQIADVRLLGSRTKLDWRQTAEGLVVKLPEEKPCRFAWCFQVSGARLRAATPPATSSRP